TEQENQDFKYRQEKRIEDEIARLAKEREEEKRQKLEESYKAIKRGQPTGIKSADDFASALYKSGMDKKFEIYQKRLNGQPLTADEIVLIKSHDKISDNIDLALNAYVTEYKA